MPLTAQQKSDLLRFTGWPQDSLTEGRLTYNSYLVDRISEIDKDEVVVEQVVKFIDRIKTIDTQIEGSIQRYKVTTIGRGDVSINVRETYMLRAERERVIEELVDFATIPRPVDFDLSFRY